MPPKHWTHSQHTPAIAPTRVMLVMEEKETHEPLGLAETPGKSDEQDPAILIATTRDSSKASQTSVTQTSSSQSSLGSPETAQLDTQTSTQSHSQTLTEDTHSTQEEVADLIAEAESLLKKNDLDDQTKTTIDGLLSALTKSKSETNQYKIQAHLLSMSSKDADMRYEVENELVKREVERLKTQNEQVEYLMSKVSSHKNLIKKYKNEIINKNKEINRLKKKINDYNVGLKKRRKSNSPNNGMLDTLGLLASQVLTEEEKPKSQSFKR